MGEKAILIRINGDIQDFQSKLKKIESETKELNSSLSTVAATAAAGFVGLAAAIGYSVAAYKEGAREEAKLANVLEQTGRSAKVSKDELVDFATSLASVTEFEDSAIVSAQAMLATFKNIGNDAIPRATEAAADLATVLGGDLNSATKMIGKALNDPVGGLTALSKAGIQFSEGQKEVIKSLVESGRAAEAQAIILDSIAGKVGGTAKAVADPVNLAKKELGELAEDIGKNFAPKVNSLASIFKNLISAFRENEGLVKFTSNLMLTGLVVTGLVAVIAGATVAFNALNAQLVASGGLIAVLTGPIGLTVIALSALTAAFVFFGDEIVASLKATFEFLKSIFLSIGKILDSFGQALLGAFELDIDGIKAGLNGIKEVFADAGTKAGTAFRESMKASAQVDVVAVPPTASNGDEISALDEANAKKQNMMKDHLEAMQKIREEAAFREQNIELIKNESMEKAAIENRDKTMMAETEFNNELGRIKNESMILDDTAAQQYQIMVAQRDLQEKRQRLMDEQEFGKKIADMKAVFRDKDVQNLQGTLSTISTLQKSSNRTLFEIGKAAAIANATINIAQGVTQALSLGPIIGPILAGLVAAAGAVQIGEIAGTTLQAAEGYSGSGSKFGERFVSTFTPREIVIPERWSEGIKKGEYSLTSSKEMSESGTGQVEVVLTMNENLAEVLEAKLIERRRMGISNG